MQMEMLLLEPEGWAPAAAPAPRGRELARVERPDVPKVAVHANGPTRSGSSVSFKEMAGGMSAPSHPGTGSFQLAEACLWGKTFQRD